MSLSVILLFNEFSFTVYMQVASQNVSSMDWQCFKVTQVINQKSGGNIDVL